MNIKDSIIIALKEESTKLQGKVARRKGVTWKAVLKAQTNIVIGATSKFRGSLPQY